MTLKDLRKRVYALLAEDESSDRVTEATVTFALNSGYRELSRSTRIFTAETVVAAVDEQASYLLPANMPEVKQVRYAGTTLELTYDTILDHNYPQWRDKAAGTPEYYLREDIRALRLYPPPAVAAGETVNIDIVGIVYPAAFDTALPLLNMDADVPLLPDEFHEVIADYAVFDIGAMILADDAGAQARAQAAFDRYQLAVKKLAACLGGV